MTSQIYRTNKLQETCEILHKQYRKKSAQVNSLLKKTHNFNSQYD